MKRAFESTMKPGWTQVTFGDVVRQVKDKVDPKESNLERYIAGEHMDTDDLRLRKWGEINEDYLGPAFHMRFKPGQVLYGSRRTYLRKVAWPHFEGICANTTYILESKDKRQLLPELLPFIMQTKAFNEHSINQSKGSVNPYVNFSDLAWYEFALPPLEEQRQIVRLLRAIEENRESYFVASQHLEICRKSYLEYVFSKKHEKVTTLDKIAEIVSGGTPSRRRQDYWNGDIPWLSPKDMKLSILADTTEHISEAAVENGAKIAPSGTIFVVVRGMILAHTFPVCRSTNEMAFNQDVRAIIPDEQIHPAFLHAWFEWAAPRYLQLVSESSHGTKRLETSQLLRHEVPCISEEQQNEVMKPIFIVDRELVSVNSRQHQLLSMKNHILSGI